MGVASLHFCVCLLVLLIGCSNVRNRPALETAFYVWQQQWSSAVGKAAKQANGHADNFMIFAAETRYASGRTQQQVMRPDWKILAEAGKPVMLVVRMGVSFARPLRNDKTRKPVLDDLTGLFQKLLSVTEEEKVTVAGIQIDYDCPTVRLDGYASMLRELRARLPDVPVSITALPTWLTSGDFPKLAKDLDYFVLQVHSIEKPKSIDQPNILCDTKKIPAYLRKLRSIRTPFYIALPTYGYHVIFNAEKEFVGFMAERELFLDPTRGYRARTVMADPVEIASVVRELKDKRPRNCLGIAWFRLPVETDQLNWTWSALRAVMAGREPEVAYTAEVRHPNSDPDLIEIWLENIGEHNTPAQICFSIDWRGRGVLALDVLNGFEVTEGRKGLVGPAPRIGEPVLAGWFRLVPRKTEISPRVGKVEVLL